ncbi:MAG: 2-dehydropantoate 2-reductase [Clostridiales bacterium]|nr:2-dehydropantoate 2-reductase [Clostridiales bacterium]
MKITVFGIGGVGGVVGGALARRNDDVYFYARGENLRAIRENGLEIESASLGNYIARPKLITNDAAEIGVTDVIFITSKGHNLDEVCREAAPMIGPETAVIPLLNGVYNSDKMAPHLPPCVLADGLIRIYCHLKGPGHVYHQSGGSVWFGMRDGSKPQILTEAAELLNEAGIPATVADDILLENWKKYVGMCGNSTVFCWYDAPAGLVREKQGYEDVVRGVVSELVSVAAAKGIRLPEDTVDNQVKAFATMQPETITSLYRDLSGGKAPERTELFHLVGSLVRMGKETGVPTPYHQAVLDKYTK